MSRLAKIRLGLLWLLWGLGISVSVGTLSAPTTEQTVTVAFLYNFLKFTDWPVAALSADTIKICITDSTPFRDEFKAIVGRPAQKKSVDVKLIELGDDLRQCHLLFLPQEEKPVRIREWLKNTDNLPILTVGSEGTFLEMGGMIVLVSEANRLQFEVNLKPVNRVGLKLNAQLLNIARKVN